MNGSNETSVLRRGLSLLSADERRKALIVLMIALLGAVASAAMVASVMPFLSVLADPSRIETTPAFARLYETLGFRSAYGFLVGLGLGALGMVLLSMSLQMLNTYASARFTLILVHSLSCRLMASYLGQPYEYFLNRHSGDMGTRVLSEAKQVVSRFLQPLMELVISSLNVAALVALLIWIDPLVAIVAFTVLGGIYGIVFLLSRRTLRRYGRIRLEANTQRFRLAAEALGGVKDIKLLGREWGYVQRFHDPSLRMAEVEVKSTLVSALPGFVIQAVAFGGVILLSLLLVDPAAFAAGNAIGTVLPLIGVYALAGQRLMPQLTALYGSATKLVKSQAAVAAVCDDLAGAHRRGLPKKVPRPLGLTQHLRLENVSYRYPNAEQAGVSGIDLTIRVGEKIGIVGSTGAGKTTLADIVLGLLRPQEGALVVDGQPVGDDRIRAWQQTVGYVPQDIFLTDAPVAENIALGVAPADIDMARVERAARIAQLDRFIAEELPEGYATHVGERGVRLSGGQRQRIGIARALYHDAELIVFDEATSALDNLTEREVMAAINALPGDKTILMIAHRLSTVKVCDRLLVLEKGHMAGLGSWDELMSGNAVFRRIAALAEAA